MQSWHPGLDQFTALLHAPFHTQLRHLLVRLQLASLVSQGGRDVHMERLRDDTDLIHLRQRFDAWDDRDGDAHLSGHLHKLEVLPVVEEQLCHRILRTQILLLFQHLQVKLQVRCLVVLLRIASHTILERLTWHLDVSSVEELPRIEPVDLFNQLRSMTVSTLLRHKTLLIRRLVTPQNQDVLDAQELQVEQHILRVLTREPRTQHMRHHLQPIVLHDGTRHSNRARTAPQTVLYIRSVRLFHIDIFTAMRRDIDQFRLKLPQDVHRPEQVPRTRTLQRWQYFE